MENSAGLRAVTYAQSWETAQRAGETEGVQRCSPQKARPGEAASEVGEAKAEELGRTSRTTGSMASEACGTRWVHLLWSFPGHALPQGPQASSCHVPAQGHLQVQEAKSTQLICSHLPAFSLSSCKVPLI